jgi:DNA-binding IclR family transcriptional regulator
MATANLTTTEQARTADASSAAPDTMDASSAQPAPPTSMVERMTAIMDAFDGPTLRLTLEEVAERTGLPRSTTHRILDQLVQLGWVARTDRGYGLGPRALGLGRPATDTGVELRHAAAPRLHELQVRTGLVVHLSVLDGTDIVYLDKLGGRAAAAVPSRVGARAPAHSTAGGKAMLALLPWERTEQLLRGHLRRRTPRTIGDLALLRQELQRIRQRHGLAFEEGESVPGVSCVAAAIRDTEGPVAAISLCGELGVPALERLAPLILAAARDTSRALITGEESVTVAAPPTDGRWAPETLDRMLSRASSGAWL